MLLPRLTKTIEAVNKIRKSNVFPGERIMLLKLCFMIILFSTAMITYLPPREGVPTKIAVDGCYPVPLLHTLFPHPLDYNSF